MLISVVSTFCLGFTSYNTSSIMYYTVILCHNLVFLVLVRDCVPASYWLHYLPTLHSTVRFLLETHGLTFRQQFDVEAGKRRLSL